MVLDERVEGGLASAPAYRQEGNLALERHESLQNERHAAKFFPRVGHIVLALEDDLSLAVVAVAARLQHGREPDAFDRPGKVVAAINRFKRCRRKAGLLEERLLGDTILCRFEGDGRRQYRQALFEEVSRRHG